jgi:hypothetical protein
MVLFLLFQIFFNQLLDFFKMPLGIFSKDSGPKPQPLTGEEKKKKEKVAGGGTSNNSSEIKDAKGSTVKLWKKTYTVERKLAEGLYIF